MNQDSSLKVPVLNIIISALIFLSCVVFLLVALAVGYCAALGHSFLYSDLIINIFPYETFGKGYSSANSIADTIRGFVRLLAGIFPALIVNTVSYVAIRYLTAGKTRALSDLARIAKGFLHQLKHPFSKS